MPSTPPAPQLERYARGAIEKYYPDEPVLVRPVLVVEAIGNDGQARLYSFALGEDDEDALGVLRHAVDVFTSDPLGDG